MSIDRWMDKDVVYSCNGILLSHKKEWNNALCSNMDGPRNYNTKWSKPEKDKYCTWNLKKLYKSTYTQNRNRSTDIENKLMVNKGDGRGKLGVWDEHIHTTIYKIGNQQGPTV